MLDQFGRAKVVNYGITNMIKLEPMKKFECNHALIAIRRQFGGSEFTDQRQMRERWMAPEVLCSQERTSRCQTYSVCLAK